MMLDNDWILVETVFDKDWSGAGVGFWRSDWKFA
jgi:hypothetical protein